MPQDVDINNLPLNEEAEPAEIDPDASYYTGFAPVDDGKHHARLGISAKFPNVQMETDRDTGKLKYYNLYATAVVVEPGTSNDGRYVSDFISSMPMQGGSCKAVAVLQACGVPSSEIPRTQAGVIKKLYEVLQGQPMVEITTQWQARPRDKDAQGKRRKPLLRGQRNFKEGKDGKRIPSVEDPETGEEVAADAVITRYSQVEG